MHGGLIEEMKACDKEPVNIYRTLKKIQAGMFRTGFNLWEIFRNLDPERKCYVTSHKFLTVLNGPLKNLIGLSDEEIIQVSDLFKTSDGQIAYEQFCHLIHDYRPPPSKLDLVQDDPNSVNKSLTRNEERVLYNTLMYIATTVTKRKLVLKPFFQDYEMIKKHSGLVTKTTFYKVLDFMGVKISKFAIDILVKRYERDDYTIKYNAFLSELDEVFQFLEANNYVDSSGRLWDPTKIPLYEKPPPGSGDQCGLRQVYLPSWINKSKVDPKEVINIILKFKQHICRNKIRIRDFFKEFDTKDTGRVDVHDFVMGLRWLSYGRVDPVNLFLNAKEIDIIMDLYADPIYPDRKLWKVLEEDLEGDMDPELLARWPCTPLDVPSQKLEDRYPQPDTQARGTCETVDDMMYGFKFRAEKCKADYEVAFLVFDKESTGYLLPEVFIEALATLPIYLTDREFEWLCQLYMERNGQMNWKRFLADIERMPSVIIDTTATQQQKKAQDEEEQIKKELAQRECNIVEILAKIKTAMRCYRARISDYTDPFDVNNTGLIRKVDFLKALAVQDLKLSDTEIDTVLDVFQYPENDELVEYKKFTRTIDEDTIQPCLYRAPLEETMKAAAEATARETPDYEFLNFNERQLVSIAMNKLAKNVTLGNLDYFKSLDKENKGTFDRYTFLRALDALNVLHLISAREFELIMKCFGVKDALDQIHMYYTEFLNALDIAFKTMKASEFIEN